MGLFSFFKSKHFATILMVNILLSVCMLIPSVLLSEADDKIREMLVEHGSETVTVYAYVLASNDSEGSPIEGFNDFSFITQTALDQETSRQLLMILKKRSGKSLQSNRLKTFRYP